MIGWLLKLTFHMLNTNNIHKQNHHHSRCNCSDEGYIDFFPLLRFHHHC